MTKSILSTKDRKNARDRYLSQYITRLSEVEERLKIQAHEPAWELLNDYLPNIRWLLQELVSDRELFVQFHKRLFQIAIYLAEFFDQTTRGEEGIELLEPLLLAWKQSELPADPSLCVSRHEVAKLCCQTSRMCEVNSIPLSARKYAKFAIYISKDLDDIALKSEAIGRLGGSYFITQEWEKAREYYQIALDLADKGEALKLKERFAHNIGNCYGNVANYSSAIQYFNVALEIARQQEDLNLIAVHLLGLAMCKEQSGKKQEAKGDFQEILSIARQTRDEHLLMSTATNLSIRLMFEGEFDTALSLLEEARETNNKFNNHTYDVLIEENYGRCYHLMKRYDQALGHYLDAFRKSKAYSFTTALARSMAFIVTLLLECGYVEQCLEAIKVCEPHVRKSSPADLPAFLSNKYDCARFTYDWDSAKSSLDEMQAVCQQHGDTRNYIISILSQSEFTLIEKDIPLAKDFARQAQELIDMHLQDMPEFTKSGPFLELVAVSDSPNQFEQKLYGLKDFVREQDHTVARSYAIIARSYGLTNLAQEFNQIAESLKIDLTDSVDAAMKLIDSYHD